MSAIKVGYGSGGAGLNPESVNEPRIDTVLREIAADFAGVKSGNIAAAALTTTAIADADATYGQPEADLINDLKAKYNTAVTLINQMRTALNAVNGYTIKTTAP